MAPAAKKQKVDNPPKSPIVFQSLGLKPDVSLKVFDVEFHVHSILLKLHSAFFRKFLDSPDKTVSPSTVNKDSASGTTPPGASAFGLSLVSVEFKYKWATKVDENEVEKWHLVEDNSKNESFNLESFKVDKKTEGAAFEKLLCAIYVLPYRIENAKVLTSLAEIADYYRALPIVSRTFSYALHDSQDFIRSIRCDPRTVFEAAAKLRHKVLFKDALVWVVGNWRYPAFKELSDRKLRQVARCAYGEIATKVANSSSSIFIGFTAVDDEIWSESFRNSICKPQETWSMIREYFVYQEQINFPSFFRRIFERDDLPLDVSMSDLNIPGLLRNNLVLDRSPRSPGESDGEDEEYFLCAEIKDEDLPWDLEEVDW